MAVLNLLTERADPDAQHMASVTEIEALGIRYPSFPSAFPAPHDMDEAIEQERIALDIRYAQLMEPVPRPPKLTLIDGGKSAGDDHAED